MAKVKVERAKDLLDPREYLKLLRADVRNLSSSDFAGKNNEDFVCSYTELFLDIAKHTPRVKASTLKTAVMLCYDKLTAESAKNFANKVSQAYQYVISKSKSYVNGTRLSAATKAVVQEYQRNKDKWEETRPRGRSRSAKPRAAKAESSRATAAKAESSRATRVKVESPQPQSGHYKLWKGSKATAEMIASSARKTAPVKEEAEEQSVAKAVTEAALVECPMTPPPCRRLFSDSPPRLPLKRRSTPGTPVSVSLGSMSPIPWPLTKPAVASPSASEVTGLASPVFRRPAAGSQPQVRRRPAAKASVIRKPAAVEESAVLKRPAAQRDEAALKKPAAADRAERGPRKFGIFSEEEILDRATRGLPREIQEQYSQGCSRCRQRRGCTDTCWRSRGYLLE